MTYLFHGYNFKITFLTEQKYRWFQFLLKKLLMICSVIKELYLC
jgi:hypothetical protein